jgi:hypothetical protein
MLVLKVCNNKLDGHTLQYLGHSTLCCSCSCSCTALMS